MLQPSVPAEFVGQARRLRSEIAAAEITAEAAIHRIWTLVRVNAARHCPPPAAAAQMWRRQVPTVGGLVRTIEHRKGRLHVVEDRMAATKFRGAWEDGIYEPSFAFVRYVLLADDMQTSIDTVTMSEFSLHSIARRFQRGAGGDAEVRADMHAMAAHRERLIEDGGEFDVAVGNDGRWVGNIAEIVSPRGEPERIVNVRSYLPQEFVR